MKILENYIKAVKELEEYFGIDYLNFYALETIDDFFTVSSNKTIIWAETEEGLENQDNIYSRRTIKEMIEGEELTLFLVDDYYGDNDCLIIFKNKNRRVL